MSGAGSHLQTTGAIICSRRQFWIRQSHLIEATLGCDWSANKEINCGTVTQAHHHGPVLGSTVRMAARANQIAVHGAAFVQNTVIIADQPA